MTLDQKHQYYQQYEQHQEIMGTDEIKRKSSEKFEQGKSEQKRRRCTHDNRRPARAPPLARALMARRPARTGMAWRGSGRPRTVVAARRPWWRSGTQVLALPSTNVM